MEFKGFLSNHALLSRILSLLVALFISQQILAARITDAQLQKLDKQYIQLSSGFYTAETKRNAKSLKRYTRPEVLYADVQNLIKNKQQISAVVLIKHNLKTLNSNIDHPAVIKILAYLLNQNAWTTANRLYQQIQNNADGATVSAASYRFARYFYNRKNYDKSLDRLNGIAEDLPGDESNHAILLSGVCLQKLKKHRQAMKVYANINTKSSFYPAAILNTSIANIRQGWWTDGNILLQKILKSPKYKNTDTVLNRLYLVLGYSLLYKEFYRDARDAFRNVGLNSPHTNRALLGIALAATNQEDYVGALNALTILKNKNSSELSVEEAYLLLPYIYEKLGQGLTASTSYTDALNHFTKRMYDLQTLKKQILTNKTDIIDAYNNGYFSLDKEKINYISTYPDYFLQNYILISRLYKNSQTTDVSVKKEQIQKLYADYQTTLNKVMLSLIEQKISNIKSYMNQSRYGLARLYDSNAEEQ